MDNLEKENKRLKYLIFVLLTITLLTVGYLTYMLYFNEDKNNTTIDNCVSEKEIPVEEENDNLYYQYIYYDELDLNDPMYIDEIVFYEDGTVKYKGDGHRTGYYYSGVYTKQDNTYKLILLSHNDNSNGENCAESYDSNSCFKTVYLTESSDGKLVENNSNYNLVYDKVNLTGMKLIK